MDTAMRGYLRNALEHLGMEKGREHGMYAPLVKRHPLRVGDEIPVHIKQNLDAHHTCACTDSNIVYVDFDNAREMFKKAREVNEEAGKLEGCSEWYTAENNFRTLLVHEYTHILMRHVEAGIKFTRANGDKNYPIFALACDIEANRGYGIVQDSDLYQIGVTDKYYPECQGVYGLMNIYRVLKKNYGDEILNDYDDQKQNIGSKGDERMEDEESNSQASSNEKDSKPQTETETEKVDSESSDEGEGSSSNSDSSEEAKREARKKALQRAVQTMEEMKEEMEEQASMMTEEELDENLECFDEEEGDGILVDGFGTGEGDDNPTPYNALNHIYHQDLAKKVEDALEKLKGMVRGSQIRTRTKTYSRQSRKEGADGLIRKGVKNKKALAPRILVAMDSSGSMSSTEVTPVATAIGTVAKMLGKTKGSFICEHDANVKNVYPLSKWEQVVKGYYPHGDNDFDNVLRKAVELNVEIVFNVGDGYCEFYDRDLMKVAHDKGIKWVDVQVCGSQQLLKSRVIEEEAPRFKDYYIGREIIKVGGEN